MLDSRGRSHSCRASTEQFPSHGAEGPELQYLASNQTPGDAERKGNPVESLPRVYRHPQHSPTCFPRECIRWKITTTARPSLAADSRGELGFGRPAGQRCIRGKPQAYALAASERSATRGRSEANERRFTVASTGTAHRCSRYVRECTDTPFRSNATHRARDAGLRTAPEGLRGQSRAVCH